MTRGHRAGSEVGGGGKGINLQNPKEKKKEKKMGWEELGGQFNWVKAAEVRAIPLEKKRIQKVLKRRSGKREGQREKQV